MQDEKTDSISEFLESETPIQHELTVRDETPLVHNDAVSDNAKKDYQQARESMKDMIHTGTGVIESLARVAEESESPRAYEVLANTLKTITEMNKALMELHTDAQKLMHQDKESPQTVNNTQFVFNGSTEDLQKALMKKDGE